MQHEISSHKCAFFLGGGDRGRWCKRRWPNSFMVTTLKLKVTKRQLFEVLLRSWDWWVKRGCTKELVGETNKNCSVSYLLPLCDTVITVEPCLPHPVDMKPSPTLTSSNFPWIWANFPVICHELTQTHLTQKLWKLKLIIPALHSNLSPNLTH